MARASCAHYFHDTRLTIHAEEDWLASRATTIALQTGTSSLYLTLSDTQLETLYEKIVSRRSEIAQRQLQEQEGVPA